MKFILRKLFRYLPFKKQFFLFIRAFIKLPESIWKHLYFNAAFSVQVLPGKKFSIQHFGFQLENELFWKGLEGGWEKESMNLWVKLVQDAKVIIDIGANTGVYSLVAKTINPDSKVYAFEPVKRVFEKLKTNNLLNGFDIVCESDAVSDKNGKAIFFDLPTEHIYSVTINQNLNAPGVKVLETEVTTITLDSYLQEKKITAVDLVKIDVETHEPEVLSGFTQGLTQCRPALLIEILNEDVGKRVEAIVQKLGYRYFNIDEKGGIRETVHIGKSDFYNYLLCDNNTVNKLGL
jgi:FkbM family methyltransferase